MTTLTPLIRAMWTVSTNNPKTGPIPTQYVGATPLETALSCEGCSLFSGSKHAKRVPKGELGGCYAHLGNVSRAAIMVRGAAKRGKPMDLATVLQRTPRSARCGRFGAIGDPSRVARSGLYSDVDLLRSIDFKVLGYTHHWKGEPWNGRLKREILASCETWGQADDALSRGWKVAVAGPHEAPKGTRLTMCPQDKKPWLTCNACGLCDVPTLKRANIDGIILPAHGQGARRLPLAGWSN